MVRENFNVISDEWLDPIEFDLHIPQIMAGFEIDLDLDEYQAWYHDFVEFFGQAIQGKISEN